MLLRSVSLAGVESRARTHPRTTRRARLPVCAPSAWGGGCFAGPPFFKSQIPPSAGLPFGLSAVWFFCASRLFAHFNRAMWHCIRRAVARLVGLFARLYFWTNFSTPLWWPAILYFRIIIHRIQLFQQEALVCLILGPLAHFRFYATAPAMWDQESSQIQHAFHRASCRRHTL